MGLWIWNGRQQLGKDPINKPTCIDNLPRCQASCCKSISFVLPVSNPKLIRGMTITLDPIGLTDDKRRYYRYHGGVVSGSSVSFVLNDYWLEDNVLHINCRCEQLTTDLRCRIHGPRQPLVCKQLNWETAKNGHFTITAGCMFHEHNN